MAIKKLTVAIDLLLHKHYNLPMFLVYCLQHKQESLYTSLGLSGFIHCLLNLLDIKIDCWCIHYQS